MKTKLEYLEKLKACPRGLDWFRARPELEGEDYKIVCAALEADGHPGWSAWLREWALWLPPEVPARKLLGR